MKSSREINAPLWRFSCAFYARPAVSSLCLELQDRCGADINLLLLGLFAATCRRRLAETEFKDLDDACAGWRAHVVVPLRTARRFLKHEALPGLDAEARALRTVVKCAELDSERSQQHFLEAAIAPLGTPAPGASISDLAESNIAAYERACIGDALDAPARPRLLQAFEAYLAES